MISAIEFLAVLEAKDLLPQEVLFSLYKQVAQSQGAMTAAELSQKLIDQGYLTPVLANRLMGWNLEQSAAKDTAKTGPESGSHVNLHGRLGSAGSSVPSGVHPDSSTVPRKEKIEVQDKKEERDDDIGFAPLQEEREPRPMLGKHRAYKTGDSSKTSGSGASGSKVPPSASKEPKPAAVPSSPPKSTILDKPPPSRWASSVYDREIDTSKGIVSPNLVKLAGTEKIPDKVFLRKRVRWTAILIRTSLFIGFAVILYIVITMIMNR